MKKTFINTENLEKKDCFAYNHYLCKCNILRKLYCSMGKCSFYKTQKQYEEDEINAYK